MLKFKAAFKIKEERHCPLYIHDEGFVLRDDSVEPPPGRPACLILLRELTKMLVTLLPHQSSGFAEYNDEVFNCGGCNGLIKFRFTDPSNVTSMLNMPIP